MSGRLILSVVVALGFRLLLAVPRSLAQAAPSASKTNSSPAGKNWGDAAAQEIRDAFNPAKLLPQLQSKCNAARRMTDAIAGDEANDDVLQAVYQERWFDVPDEAKDWVTDYLNAEVESDGSCGALQMNRGDKRQGLHDLNDLTRVASLRADWDRWLWRKQLGQGIVGEDVAKSCDQLAERYRHLPIQSDAMILKAAEARDWDQIPSEKVNEVFEYYYTRANRDYVCAVQLVGQLTEPAFAGDSLLDSADYNGRSLGFLIRQYNRLVRDYSELSDSYAKLKADDDDARKLIELDNRLIAQADAALGLADRALSMPPPLGTVLVLSAPIQPIELHCVTTVSGAAAYTNCY